MNWLLLAGSLAAILFLAAVARWLGLGASPRITGIEQAIALAEETVCGFAGIDAAIDRSGYAAIVRNAAGRQMVIRVHGNHFAARLIDARFIGRLDKTMLTLVPPDRNFGPVTLELGSEAARWAAGLRAVLHA